MNISIKREQNNARISSAEREKFGAKLKTKTIFKALAMTMLMPAMLLTTACSNEDDFVNNSANTENTINKGYALPVTVNVTRQDAGTRATYTDNGDGTGSLGFSAGDKLFVSGSATGAGKFAGALDYVPATGKFSGTIYTENNYDGTADALFTAPSSVRAILLPNGYDSYNFLYIDNKSTDVLYDDVVAATISKAFVASETAKKTGVEQLSWEQAYTYSSGFALAPANAVLNFTISGLETGEKAVTLITKYSGMDFDQTMSGSVTPNASGVATFAIGVPNNLVIKNVANNLTVGSSNFTLSSTAVAAGKIYNITRNAIPGALIGQFSVSNTKKVYFSKGNLRYASGTWSFFDHQYDCYNTYSENAWDKFGWSTSANNYGMSTSTTPDDYSGNFVDWGATMGTGWRTLTSDEWTYLFNTRTVNGGTGGGKSYTLGQSVNGKLGVVLYPDNYTGAVYSGSDWATFESAGCVFLPAAGYRNGSSVLEAGTVGIYRSATPYGSDYAYIVDFNSGNLNPAANGYVRGLGFSVRLVRQVE